MSAESTPKPGPPGINDWLEDELRQQYSHDRRAVDESWKEVFDLYPLPHSPGYHTFRSRYGWESSQRGTHGLVPDWKANDLREGRIDPCEDWV